MKLCITSTGRDMASKVDTRFGRASFFIIIDTDTNGLEVVKNSAVEQGQGAGIGAAALVLDKGVDGLLTGRIGPNALKVFQESGIRLCEGVSSEDTVAEALAKFNKGEYHDVSAQQGVSSIGPGGKKGLGRGGRGGGQGMGMGRGRGQR